MKSFALAALLLCFAAAVKQGRFDLSMDESFTMDLPTVPKVENAGDSGFPELPTVDLVREKESSGKAVQSIKQRADQLQAQMVQAQQHSALRLKRQKGVFDKKLKAQEIKNQLVVRENKEMAKKIVAQKQANKDEREKALEMRKVGADRREQLSLLQEQLKRMSDFLAETLVLEDKEVPNSDVLMGSMSGKKTTASQRKTTRVSKKKPSFTQMDEEAHDDRTEATKSLHEDEEDDETKAEPVKQDQAATSDDKEETGSTDDQEETDHSAGLSFLSLDESTSQESEEQESDDQKSSDEDDTGLEQLKQAPNKKADLATEEDIDGLFAQLNKAAQEVRREGKAGQRTMKDIFLKDFKQGVARKQALKRQQKVLKSTESQMTKYQARISVAVKGLQDKDNDNVKRMHKAGSVLKQLGKLAHASSEEALPELLAMRNQKMSGD